MRIWPLAGTGIAVAAAFALLRALLTHDGVGPLEYVAGAALLALLALASVRLARQTVRRS
jgi:hypothetical protein